jgi:hypothetical protein
MHAEGFAHRDLKPKVQFLCEKYQAYIGLAIQELRAQL